MRGLHCRARQTGQLGCSRYRRLYLYGQAVHNEDAVNVAQSLADEDYIEGITGHKKRAGATLDSRPRRFSEPV
ncbi:MAG: hypothetical protein VXW49_00400 [Pseudomonadota bacterium]|nr:hypothetical protein [Pseudomonadota bacterium]